jgi:PAS domain S-box-containing protein
MQKSHDDARLRSASPAAPALAVNGSGDMRLAPELYVRVLDSMTEGVSIAGEDGIIVYTNAAEDRMFGYSSGELIGQHVSVQNAYGIDENLRLVSEVIEHLKADGVWTGEWRNKRKDGSEFQTFARITTVPVSGKRLFVCVQEDITKRKQVEEELRGRTEELTDFFENATVGLHWVGPDGTILWANQAELDLLGYMESEYIGRNISEFHVDRDVIEDILCRLTSKQELHSYEARLRCKDGSVRHVLISSNVYWKDGQFIHTRCFTRDITDRKIAEEAITRLGAIVESSDDAIISKDLNGIIRSWNSGAERIFGYTADEIVGKPVTTLAVPERVEEIPNILERIRRGERLDHYITKRQTKGGRVLTISLTVSPIRDSTGRIIGASKVARDITERENAEQMLRAANNALSRANNDLEQFAYAAAHDLKEPLRMVTVYSQMLNRSFGDVLGADGQKFLAYSIQGAQRMDALVQGLLAYLQASTFGQDLPSAIDANAALERAVQNLQLTIEESGASITRAKLPAVRVHEVHLEQLFQNLLGNAIKYRGQRAPCIAVGCEESSSGETVIFIRDNGIGIAPEYKEQVFELFKRLHTSDRYSGSGLGLSICKRILEHYGCRIWVESEPGQGSTFYFTLPAGHTVRRG